MFIDKSIVNIWYEYYTSTVSDFHTEHTIIDNAMPKIVSYKSLYIPKMLTRELSSYVLAEATYPSELNLPLNTLIAMTEATMALGQILLVYVPTTDTLHSFTANTYEYDKKKDIVEIKNPDETSVKINIGRKVITYYNENGNAITTEKCILKTFSLVEDIEYPYGKSVFADCLDVIKSVDMRYTNFYKEFELGKPKVIVTEDALRVVVEYPTQEELQKNPNARPEFKQYLSPDDEVFKVVAGDPTNIDKQSPIKQIEFKLRTNEFIEAINLDLALISKQAGFDNSFMAYDGTYGLKTATEVISRKSQLYKNIKIYQSKIYNLLVWLCELKDIDYVDKIKFGDSVIQSDEQLKQDGLNLVGVGAVDKETLLVKYFNFTVSEARIVLERLEQEHQDELDKEIALINADNTEEQDDGIIDTEQSIDNISTSTTE